MEAGLLKAGVYIFTVSDYVENCEEGLRCVFRKWHRWQHLELWAFWLVWKILMRANWQGGNHNGEALDDGLIRGRMQLNHLLFRSSLNTWWEVILHKVLTARPPDLLNYIWFYAWWEWIELGLRNWQRWCCSRGLGKNQKLGKVGKFHLYTPVLY